MNTAKKATCLSVAKLKLKEQAKQLAKEEFLVGSNEGTYFDREAVEKVGSSDPRYAVLKIWESVNGALRYSGPNERTAPGRVRRWQPLGLLVARVELAKLRKQIGEEN